MSYNERKWASLKEFKEHQNYSEVQEYQSRENKLISAIGDLIYPSQKLINQADGKKRRYWRLK